MVVKNRVSPKWVALVDTWTKTCGPFPGGEFLTHTHSKRNEGNWPRLLSHARLVRRPQAFAARVHVEPQRWNVVPQSLQGVQRNKNAQSQDLTQMEDPDMSTSVEFLFFLFLSLRGGYPPTSDSISLCTDPCKRTTFLLGLFALPC